MLSFNREVDPATVEGSVRLGDLAADAVTDGETVTLRAQAPFAYLEEVEVVVATDLRDVGGGALGGEHRSSFTVRFRRWEPRQVVGDAFVGDYAGPYPGPQLTGLPDGRAVALWQHGTGGDLRISWSMYQRADDAWSPAAEIGQSDTPMDPHMSAAGGWTLAAWSEGAAVRFTSSGQVSVFRRTIASDWTGEVLGPGSRPAVAVDDSGTTTRADRVRIASGPGGAFAAWGVVLADGGEVHVRIREGGVWGDDEIIATTRTALDTLPELAVTALGDLVVAWDDWNGGLYARWRRIDGDGNAMITWTTDRASYDLAGEDRWIESELMLDTYLLRAAFAGSDPVVIGQQEGGAAPDVHVAIYR